MRRAILAILVLCILTFPAIAKERGLGMYLTGKDAVEMSDVERLHYVVGLMDAWLLEAFITDGERFGWLMDCTSKGLAAEAPQLEAIFRGYLNNHLNELDQAGSALFFFTVFNFCNSITDQRVMFR